MPQPKTEGNGPPKKSDYVRPRLIEYGHVARLTRGHSDVGVDTNMKEMMP